LAAALVTGTAACSDAVSGSAEQGAPGEMQAPAITGSVSSPVLDRLPANASTLSDIALIDPAALTEVALRRDYPAAGSNSDERPAAETKWLDQVGVSNPCGTVLDASYSGLRSGDAGPSSSIVLGTAQKSGTLAVCGGAVPEQAALASTEVRGDGVAAATVAGIDGYRASRTWIGVDRQQSLTYITDGTDIPEDLVQQAIAGPAADPPLSKDARVRTVLAAVPKAAMVEMGTELVTGSSPSAPAAVRTAFEQAVAQGGYQQAPIPQFGGYGWTPGSRITGTATFVTIYGSPQEAATAVKILTDTWSRLGTSKFTGAVTRRSDAAVVTTLADVGSTEFKVQSGQLAEYPGFLARN